MNPNCTISEKGADMSKRPKDHDVSNVYLKDPSRREFVALSAVAGLSVYGGVVAAAEAEVVARDVVVKTPDGNCDAAFFHPAAGAHPGVLIWTDAFGLRPAFRDLGRRLA